MDMRTFAQKQNQFQQIVSSSLARSNTLTPGPPHCEHPTLHLQRTIGNQAMQPILQTNDEELKAGLTGTASSHFEHDFSRIPIHPPASGEIQTKLAINKLGDQYEKEADRISEHVMRMPNPQIQRSCACSGGCPRCQTEQPGQTHEHLQVQRVQANDAGEPASPLVVHEVLRSPGQPLYPATRAFMEPRFGHDFSRVRVHTDSSATESARAVNALAYTVGHNIVFGAGLYAPNTTTGRRLLAHELAHVAQGSRSGAALIQRKADLFGPTSSAPADWKTKVEAAKTSADRAALIQTAVGLTVSDVTATSAADTSPNSTHLTEFSISNQKINYDDGLNSKTSPVDT